MAIGGVSPYASMLKNPNFRVESVRPIERRKDEEQDGYKNDAAETPSRTPAPKSGRIVDLSI
ncbi:MAG: hypothetical protein ABWZ40_09635 [Caulobacterales bacterium]